MARRRRRGRRPPRPQVTVHLRHRHDRPHTPMLERRRHALAVGVALLAVAALITVVVSGAGPSRALQALDDRWLAWMGEVRTAWATRLGRFLSKLGGPLVTFPLRVAVTLVLAWQRHWLRLGAFLGAVVTSELCIGPLKALVDRPRPPGGLVGSTSASFPSGHAIAGAVTAFGLVLVFARPSPRRLVWIGLAAGFAALMALSRTYLAVHWLSDVVAGACIGTGWALVWSAGLELARERWRRDHVVAFPSPASGPDRVHRRPWRATLRSRDAPHDDPRGAAEMSDWRSRKQQRTVRGLRMAYVDEGSGPAVVFLHGNPTSSYLWRDVIGPVRDAGFRCVAPDLVGMGDSDKLATSGPGSYTFVEHREYLDDLLDGLDLGDDVTLVVHDWGSALGFDWARRHPDRVAGIAYMEAIVTPLTWDDWPGSARSIFQAMRSPGGEEMCLQKNVFVERILPASIQRTLSEEEMAEYRRPFAEPGEGRRPTLTWPRQIPIDGEPADVVDIVQAYADWLATAPVPKLFIDAEPATILIGRQRELCRSWPNQHEVEVAGLHFIQEDSAAEIAEAVRAWRSGLG